jgi:hypothetical protein
MIGAGDLILACLPTDHFSTQWYWRFGNEYIVVSAQTS